MRPSRPAEQFVHEVLPSGVEFAVDVLPARGTVALSFRVLCGLADEPEELTGLSGIVERTLSKGTTKYDGQALASAFDAIGAQWGSASGRQSTLVRVLCLPEFLERAVELVAELIVRPTFPDEACRVAVELALEERRQLDDDPQSLLQIALQRLALGPRFGRHGGGELDTLPRITPDHVRAHWQRCFHSGGLQVAAAGPVQVERLRRQLEREFAGFGSSIARGREAADFAFTPGRAHRHKDLTQEYIGLSLEGAPKGDVRFPAEVVMLTVLSGGTSGRLFTEVREKQGLVYWVAAWHEQPRGRGLISMGASATPERCDKAYETLLRELQRISEDLSEDEVARARHQIAAHSDTEDDLTRARAGGLSDDLFHFSRPIGQRAKLDAIAAVTTADVKAYALSLQRERVCVATLGPCELG